MLEHRVLLESPVARVAAVRCPGGRAWSPEEEVDGAGTADLIAELLPARRVEAHPLIDEVRALLHANPSLDLGGLASAVGWSPWHLSRVFHRATGSTLNAYRRRLRVRAALDELPGSPDLAQLAVRVGFADQAHMTRAVRAETGRTPAALRRSLTSASRSGV